MRTTSTKKETYRWKDVLTASDRVQWRVEDLIGGPKRLDFTKPFLPEKLVRANELPFLSAAERLKLNQIRGYGYLRMFGLVEEFILPFVTDHVRPDLNGEDYRVRALLSFASEEAKHIHLFRRFREEFEASFGADCGFIGPAEAIGAEVLRHGPLAVALAILLIEWMTQHHYVDAVKSDVTLDPLFVDLLKHHWMEESQHAKMDTLIVESLAAGMTPHEIEGAVGEFAEIGTFIDGGLQQQVELDLEAFENAIGRELGEAERTTFRSRQLQALRYLFLGSGMGDARFLSTMEELGARETVEEMAPAFC